MANKNTVYMIENCNDGEYEDHNIWAVLVTTEPKQAMDYLSATYATNGQVVNQSPESLFNHYFNSLEVWANGVMVVERFWDLGDAFQYLSELPIP